MLYWTPLDDTEEEDPNVGGSGGAQVRWLKRGVKTFSKGVPHDLAFKPDSSILAVGEKYVVSADLCCALF